MTNTKRMPRPLTSKELAQYWELKAQLIVQSELILRIFDSINAEDDVTKVEFELGYHDEPRINIWHHWRSYGEDYDDYFSCPERYFNMTEDELKAEKARLEEEEKRKKAEKATKEKAARERRKAKREAERKAKEKDKRYKKYLELKKEFEDTEDK